MNAILAKGQLWSMNSRYAVVTCFQQGEQLIVQKIIAPNTVTKLNAKWVNDVSAYFRNELRALKVPLAEPYLLSEEEGKAIQTSPYAGPDLEKFFQSHSVIVNINLLEKLFKAIQGVLTQKIPNVGIDARLSNFCLSEVDGSVCYVDTFPPLVKYENNYIVHFPNPTDPHIVEQEFKRKFEPLGILRRLRFSILEQDIGISEKNIIDAIKNVMGEEFAGTVEDFFNTFLDKLEIDEAIDKLMIEDPDGIRELALKCMPPKGDVRQKFLSEIFDLSSNFCPLPLNSEERLSRIKQLLR